MRRSEMVKAIKDLIECNLDNLYQIPDATLVAELILYHQEKCGMKPPITKRCPVLLTQVHTWEKE